MDWSLKGFFYRDSAIEITSFTINIFNIKIRICLNCGP